MTSTRREVNIMISEEMTVAGVSLRKLLGATIRGIPPGQRAAAAALWCSRQRSTRKTISVMNSSNSRVCGSWHSSCRLPTAGGHRAAPRRPGTVTHRQHRYFPSLSCLAIRPIEFADRVRTGPLTTLYL